MTTLEVLRSARELVAKGWCQGEFTMEAGGHRLFCAAGAICESSGGSGALYEDARSAVRCVTGQMLTQWNDADGRTQAEVLAAFDEAIRREG